jgi:AraC-like DNA-binding protein
VYDARGAPPSLETEMAPRVDSLDLASVEALLEQPRHAPFFTKDAALRYVSVNRAMLRLCRATDRSMLVGKTAREFFPDWVWRRQEEQDRKVMRTRIPCSHWLEVLLEEGGQFSWWSVQRRPVLDASGEVVGVAGLARSLSEPDYSHPKFSKLRALAASVRANMRHPLDADALAKDYGCTSEDVGPEFEAVFGISLRRYQTWARINAAMEMLRACCRIADVARECGFVDQGAFARRFRALVGLSPGEYRRSLLTA